MSDTSTAPSVVASVASQSQPPAGTEPIPIHGWKPASGPAPATAIELKEQGNKEFGVGNVAEAAETYRKALGILAAVAGDDAASGADGEDAKENSSPPGASSAGLPTVSAAGCEPVQSDSLAVVLYSNLAACYLRLEQPAKALVECDAAVAINPSHVKVRHHPNDEDMFRTLPFFSLSFFSFFFSFFLCLFLAAPFSVSLSHCLFIPAPIRFPHLHSSVLLNQHLIQM